METKKQFKWFTIYEYEKEQEYLRRMHREGWKFRKVSGLGMYHFEACVPEDVVYQLDYNQEGLAHKDEYVQMFRDCDWEYLQDYAGYSYFRKAVSEDGIAEEIFCDSESRLQMMERVFKGRMQPLLALFCSVLIPLFILSLTVYHCYPLAVFLGCILAIYLLIFASCSAKYNQYKNSSGH